MTRQLTITAAEWASVQDGTLWLVREGWPEGYKSIIGPVPPVEFVQACAPCKTCGDSRHDGHWHGGFVCRRTQCFGADDIHNCTDCRIELVGPCPTCNGTGAVIRPMDIAAGMDPTWGPCSSCHGEQPVILGYAYPVGQPLPIVRLHGGSPCITVGSVGAFLINGGRVTNLTAALAHAGPPESLVGKWALMLKVVGS